MDQGSCGGYALQPTELVGGTLYLLSIVCLISALQHYANGLVVNTYASARFFNNILLQFHRPHDMAHCVAMCYCMFVICMLYTLSLTCPIYLSLLYILSLSHWRSCTYAKT